MSELGLRLRRRDTAFGIAAMEYVAPAIPWADLATAASSVPAENPSGWASIGGLKISLNNLEARYPEGTFLGEAIRNAEFRDGFSFSLTTAQPREPTPDELRDAAERAAAYEPQGEWSRWYQSVTGLRCRNCHVAFDDGEHAYWCPA